MICDLKEHRVSNVRKEDTVVATKAMYRNGNVRYVENAAQVVISNETPSRVFYDDAMGDLGLYILSQKSKTGSGSQVQLFVEGK